MTKCVKLNPQYNEENKTENNEQNPVITKESIDFAEKILGMIPKEGCFRDLFGPLFFAAGVIAHSIVDQNHIEDVDGFRDSLSDYFETMMDISFDAFNDADGENDQENEEKTKDDEDVEIAEESISDLVHDLIDIDVNPVIIASSLMLNAADIYGLMDADDEAVEGLTNIFKAQIAKIKEETKES